MNISPFQLEQYFEKYEFSARYLLSSSDCEALSFSELLTMADAEMVHLWKNLKLGYTETWGHPLLREEVAGLYKGISMHEIVEVVPEEGIFLSMHALLSPQDHVICTFPGYQSLYEVAQSIGCEITNWVSDEERGWHFDTEDLARSLRENTKMVIINFPHNPTGYVPSREDFDNIVDLVRKQGAYLYSDEMYQYLEAAEGIRIPSACEKYERAISLAGLSKSYGLPGLRVGWLASQDAEFLKRISQLKAYTTICGSAPSEILAIIALRSRSHILQAQNKRIRRNLQELDRFFVDHEDHFLWNQPRGGSICFPRMVGVESTTAFCEQLVKDTGIMLAPSSLFQFGDQHVRIGFGKENLPEVLQRFDEYLVQHFH